MITIGVTGHRASRLGGVELTALADAVDQALGRVELAATFPVQMRLITALADGADTIVAECALARGWLLASVLPFAREAYLADFTLPDSRAAYQRLLAASQAVFELPGMHQVDESPGAYESAGRFVLAQADVLLTIWDGGPAQGQGGTAQIVAEAVAQDIPVILIGLRDGHVPILLWGGFTGHDPGGHNVATVPRGSLDALPGLIRALRLGREQFN